MKSDYKMKDQIQKTLKEQRYTFGNLADSMGYTQQHLSNVLNHKTPGSTRFFFILCATINNMTGSTFTTNDFQEYMK